MTTNELIGFFNKIVQAYHNHIASNVDINIGWSTENVNVPDEIIQRLRELDELKEIIRCGVPLLEEFIKDLEVHER